MNIERLVKTLASWVTIDKTSGREREFLEVLQRSLEARGYRCIRQEVATDRWNLLALTRSDSPRLLYTTHVDTVPPHIPPRIELDRIYGRGTCDTTGGILAMLEAADRLKAEQHDVAFLAVVGEEVDHCGAIKAQELSISPDRIILCEPTENKVIKAQKGMIKARFEAEGIAGHSAYPDMGVSAIHRLIKCLNALLDADWPVDPILGPATVNVGTIEGGVAANVFAPAASAEVLIRLTSDVEQARRIIQACLLPGVSYVITASNDPVFFDPPEGVDVEIASFNTDATYLQTLGPVWLVGPGDIKVAHSTNEHLTFQSLEDGIELYERLGRLALEG